MKESVRKHEKRQMLVYALSDTLWPLASPAEIQFTAARFLGEHLRVDRVVYADIENGNYITRQSWTKDVAAFVGRRPVTPFGQRLLDSYTGGEAVVVTDVRNDPRFTEPESSILLSSEIVAFTLVMRLKAAQRVSAFSAENATPRLWQHEEIELIRNVAERTWEAVDRACAAGVLRESEQRLRLALDATGGGSWTWQAQTNQVYWDERFRAQFGFTKGEKAEFEAWFDCVHKDDRQQMLRFIGEVLHTNTRDTWDNTYRAMRSDGTIFWMRSLGRVSRDAKGQVSRLTGLELDITQQRNAEEGLRLSEHKLRLSLHAANLGTWQYDLDSGVFVVDETSKLMHGLNPDEPVEKLEDGGRRVHPEDIPGIQLRFEQAVANHVTCEQEYRVVHPNGEIRWIASLGMLQPGTSSFFGIVQDVTARKRAELDLQDRQREQERTLHLLLESAAQGILLVDATGLIVTANKAAETMFGWERNELVGEPLKRLLPAAFPDRHAVQSATSLAAPALKQTGIGTDLIAQRKDGSTFPIEISLNYVTTAGGERAIAFVTDISARKQAEDAIRRSYAEQERRTLQLRRLASQLTLAEQHAREQLARTLHDGLQQLLFSAKVNIDRVVKSDVQTDHAGLLLKTRANIAEAIEAARTLSVNLFPPVLLTGGLAAALAWLAQRTQDQFKVMVNLKGNMGVNPKASDVRILLFEAVRELLFNAVKHAHIDHVEICLELRSDGTIRIRVSDQGVGFDPAIVFNQENLHQAGLGLFSIQERLALLGGNLDIQSAPGKGATFSLTLPQGDLLHPPVAGAEAQLSESGREEPLVSDNSSGSTPQPLRILIADDHALVRAGLRELFSERPGLQVVGEATNGVEAISQAAALTPDVIVMDVSMPQKNGIEATREIHSLRPHIHIVGLSTFDDEMSKRSMRKAGAETYFTKNEGTDRLLDYLVSLRVPPRM